MKEDNAKVTVPLGLKKKYKKATRQINKGPARIADNMKVFKEWPILMYQMF